jgi:hypothetical protein
MDENILKTILRKNGINQDSSFEEIRAFLITNDYSPDDIPTGLKRPDESKKSFSVSIKSQIIVCNIISLTITFISAYFFMLAGIVFSEAATPEELRWIDALLFFNTLYVAASIWSVVLSHLKKSLLWTIWPIGIPLLVVIVVIFLQVLQS